MNFKQIKKLAVIFAVLFLSFYIRVVNTDFDNVGKAVSPDSKLYLNYAKNITEGNGYVQNIRRDKIVVPPIYPLFISFLCLFGNPVPVKTILIVQIILSLVNMGFLYAIGKKYFNVTIGTLAAVIFAFAPMSIHFNQFVLTEILYALLLTIFLYSLLRSLFEDNRLLFIFTGVVLGITNLTRPILLFVFPLLFVLFLIQKGKKGIFDAGIITIVSFLLILPWAAYISLKYKHFILVSSYSGVNLYMGNNPSSNPRVQYNSRMKCYEDDFLRDVVSEAEDSFEKDKIYNQRAVNYIRKHPLIFLNNNFLKQGYFYGIVTYEKKYPIFQKIINENTDKYIMTLGIIALFLLLIKNRNLFYPFVVLIFFYSFMVACFIVVSGGRYRFPIMPYFIILSSYSVYEIFRGIKWMLNLLKQILWGLLKRTIEVRSILAKRILIVIRKHSKLIGGTVVVSFIVIISGYIMIFKVNRYPLPAELKQEIMQNKKIIKNNPKDPYAYYNLAVTYSYANRLLEGWNLLKRVDRISPNFMGEAICKYMDLVNDNPDDWRLRYRLFFALYFSYRREEGIEQLEEIIKTRPDDIWAYAYLAVAYDGLKQREKAVKLLKKALNMNSRIAVFHLGLASGYAKLNNKALARKEFLKGLQLLFSGW